jgi:hypothetical protein
MLLTKCGTWGNFFQKVAFWEYWFQSVAFGSKSQITIAIENNYNTYEFGGKKSVVLSTTTWIGGKNDFLGTAYILIGGLSLVYSLIFLLMYVMKPR